MPLDHQYIEAYSIFRELNSLWLNLFAMIGERGRKIGQSVEVRERYKAERERAKERGNGKMEKGRERDRSREKGRETERERQREREVLANKRR